MDVEKEYSEKERKRRKLLLRWAESMAAMQEE
jgi:hypothetical protein